MTTINGKSLSDVMAAIKEPSTVPKKKKGDYFYTPYSAYPDRLNSVLGTEHYNIRYKNIENVTLPSGQSFLCSTCELSFIDDSGNICFTVHGIGTFELNYSDTSKRYIMLNNSGIRLQQQALKAACKSILMFGEQSPDEEHVKTGSERETISDKNTDVKKPVKEVFYTSGKFQIIKKEDEKSHKPVYKVYGNRVVGSVMEKSLSAIIFYPNLYDKSIDTLNSMISLCRDNRQHKLSIMVTVSDYRKEDAVQYIFRGFA